MHDPDGYLYNENGSKNRSGGLQDFRISNKSVPIYACPEFEERCHGIAGPHTTYSMRVTAATSLYEKQVPEERYLWVPEPCLLGVSYFNQVKWVKLYLMHKLFYTSLALFS